MRANNFAGDVKAQTKALRRFRLPRSLRHGLEERCQLMRRNRALIADLDAHVVRMRAVDSRTDFMVAAVLQSVSDQVGKDLQQAIGIPYTARIAVPFQLQDRFRMCGVQLVHRLAHEPLEIG